MINRLYKLLVLVCCITSTALGMNKSSCETEGSELLCEQTTSDVKITATIAPKKISSLWDPVEQGLGAFNTEALGYSSIEELCSQFQPCKIKIMDNKNNVVCGAKGTIVGKYLFLDKFGCAEQDASLIKSFVQKIELFALDKKLKMIGMTIAQENPYFKNFLDLGYKAIAQSPVNKSKHYLVKNLKEAQIKEDGFKLLSLYGADAKNDKTFFSSGVETYVQALTKKSGPDLYLHVVVKDKNGSILGGCLSKLYFKTVPVPYVDIDTLWIDKSLRRLKLGSKLMHFTEKLAAKYGCHIAVVGTNEFQAPGFYTKIGYEKYMYIEELLRGKNGIFYGNWAFFKKI